MESSLNTLLIVAVQVFMLVGLFGLAIPIFPGILVIWLAALAFGLLGGWSGLGVALFIVISLFAIAGTVVDNVMMGIGARKGGAAWASILLAMLAGLVGTVVFPPIGGLIAAPGVVLLLEYRRQGTWELAWQALKGLAAGWGLSFIARFAIGLVMMALWWLWAWRG